MAHFSAMSPRPEAIPAPHLQTIAELRELGRGRRG